jgi:hypothetical protein
LVRIRSRASAKSTDGPSDPSLSISENILIGRLLKS